MIVTIKALEQEDIDRMVIEMRGIDRLEAEAMSGCLDLAAVLERAGSVSKRARAGYADDRLIAIWGIAAPTLLSSNGCPWLVATDAIMDKDVRRAFLRHSLREYGLLVEGYSHLANFVHRNNAAAIRWLKWLGFDFPSPVAQNINGEPFLYFKKEIF